MSVKISAAADAFDVVFKGDTNIGGNARQEGRQSV